MKNNATIIRYPFRDAEGEWRFPAGPVSLSAMTFAGARDRVARWVQEGRKGAVLACSANDIVHAADSLELTRIIEAADMATTDGMPLVWMARRWGFARTERVYGPDLMLALCELGVERGFSHYFYGGTDEVLARMEERLLARFPGLRIAGKHAPPFRPLNSEEVARDAQRINAAKPDLVWCGLGAPKQDFWVADFRPRLEAPAVLAVGAAFNVHAGLVRQAPRWMMRLGLEWLFRLGVEPRRLARRYLIGNPRFVRLTWRQWWIHAPRYARRAL